ncbi:uncharacterized protein LOC129743097 isoform X3 [Uranotaenia lowii]|uniref:uncharacterized protein LOC129743097 isoform X3 n=1 Tax=Uranotaenia lowii TaxID=190385 RepID=UPI00247A8917|nr:uncharacterized protein LOC129743097 isoform X3 [Uranotaenia lowii]
MASKSTYNILGYIYTGLCLTGSLLLIINVSTAIEATGVSVASVVVTAFSSACLLFSLVLLFGIVRQNIRLITLYLCFLVVVFVLMELSIIIVSQKITSYIADYILVKPIFGTACLGLFLFLSVAILGFVVVGFSLAMWLINGLIIGIQEEPEVSSLHSLVNESCDEK